MTVALDFSDARPGGAAIAAAGVVGVLRYIGYDERPGAPKLARPGELADYYDHGLLVGLVWETSGILDGGENLGRAHGDAANPQLDALGWPHWRPSFFAHDRRADTDTARGYMDGVRRECAWPVGAYGGSGTFQQWCHDDGIAWLWAVRTWGVTGDASLVQEPNLAPPIGGTDYNTVLARDWGGYHPSMTTPSDHAREFLLLNE